MISVVQSGKAAVVMSVSPPSEAAQADSAVLPDEAA